MGSRERLVPEELAREELEDKRLMLSL